MSVPSDPLHTSGQPTGGSDFVISKSGQLLKGDPAEGLDLMSRALEALNEQKKSTLQKMISEYEKLSGKESRQDPKIQQLIDPLKAMLKDARLAEAERKIQDALGEARSPGLSPQDLGEIISKMGSAGGAAKALAMFIMEMIAEMPAEPTLKQSTHEKKKDAPGLNLGDMDVGENLVFIMQALSKDLREDLHNMLGELQQTQAARKKRRRRTILGLVGGILGLGLVFGFGLRFFAPPAGGPGAGNQIPATAPPSSASVCEIKFIEPSSAAGIPGTGPLNFQWTNIVEAFGYSLEVAPPASASLPWIFSVKGTSKTIYMENFTAGGDYQVSVNALSEGGGILCTAVLKFNKAAADPSAGNNRSDAGKCVNTGMFYQCP